MHTNFVNVAKDVPVLMIHTQSKKLSSKPNKVYLSHKRRDFGFQSTDAIRRSHITCSCGCGSSTRTPVCVCARL